MLISRMGCTAATGRPAQKTDLHQVRFINILNGNSLFANRRSKGFQTDRTSIIILNQRRKQAPVICVKAKPINFQPVKGKFC